MSSKVLSLLSLLALSVSVTLAESSKPPVTEDEMVSRYVNATHAQQDSLRGGSMEVDIDASLPKLKKEGRLQALKNISKLGKITFRLLGFSGDNTIKTEVIARYLRLEMDGAQDGSNVSINNENYKFKYKGTEAYNDRTVYVLHITPRHKKVGLFKGELWLDTVTYMPVRESGAFVKSPSIFVKKMQFVRKYDLQNGVAVPQRLESKAEIRFIGKVELNVNFQKFSKEETETITGASIEQQQ